MSRTPGVDAVVAGEGLAAVRDGTGSPEWGRGRDTNVSHPVGISKETPSETPHLPQTLPVTQFPTQKQSQ